MLEEVRMLANDKQLEAAVKVLEDMPESGLKQLRALQCFEASMCNMSLHRYEICGEKFQKVKSPTLLQQRKSTWLTNTKMVSLNNWSHGLYYYMAACARIEAYRVLLETQPEKAVRVPRASSTPY